MMKFFTNFIFGLVILLTFTLSGIFRVGAQNLVANADFSNGTNGWTFMVSDPEEAGAAFYPGSPTGFATIDGTFSYTICDLDQNIPTVAGAIYQVSFQYEMGASEPLYIRSTPVSFAAQPLPFTYTDQDAVVTNSYIVQATDTNSLLQFEFNTDTGLWGQSVGYIVVQPVIPPQCNLLSASNSQLTMGLAGTPGVGYTWQTTTSLVPPVDWQSFATNFADTNGACTCIVTNPVAPSFFRTVLK